MGQKASTAAAGAQPPRLLCRAGHRTADTVKTVCADFGISVVTAGTVSAALRELDEGSFVAVVAALGTDDATMIFDRGGDRSTLIAAANAKAGCRAIVFSHTACREVSIRRACEDAGADAVLCSGGELRELVQEDCLSPHEPAGDVLPPPPPTTTTTPTPPPTRPDAPPSAAAPPAVARTVHAHYASPEAYGPVARRAARDAALERALGPRHKAVQKSRAWTATLLTQIRALGRPLTAPAPAAGSGRRAVRFVFCSDTHAHHDSVYLPPGDVLLHAGDAVGNYGDKDVREHFRRFVAWLTAMAGRYEHVVFIAGACASSGARTHATRPGRACPGADARARARPHNRRRACRQPRHSAGRPVLRRQLGEG